MTSPPAPDPDGLLLTAKEAANELRISSRTLRRRRREGCFPNEVKDHGRVRIPRADISAYQASLAASE